jgi:hypothetical protein
MFYQTPPKNTDLPIRIQFSRTHDRRIPLFEPGSVEKQQMPKCPIFRFTHLETPVKRSIFTFLSYQTPPKNTDLPIKIQFSRTHDRRIPLFEPGSVEHAAHRLQISDVKQKLAGIVFGVKTVALVVVLGAK